ncbi:dyslexia-associated protein KIAA0319-like protein [Anthonomus grandis grandis]|uniref:dyslexia-associated protein KIAA0319-like protein n=1 Tax=Anthonomus grandis grandis TaxID=2921223 RepID=UPI002165E7B8|nr:dyslexia-associated protein KIAA0319-like protein [Anthonomus grandis grandis]
MESLPYFALLAILLGCVSPGYLYPSTLFKNECPRLYPRVFKGFVPRGNISAGFYDEIKGINTMKLCVQKCCIKATCHVAFMTDDKCYHVACSSNELCIPTRNTNPDTVNHVAMVLVKPTDEDTWEDVLAPQEFSTSQLDREVYNLLNDRTRYESPLKALEDDILFDDNYGVACEVGVDNSCQLPNEVCVQTRDRSRTFIGTCECKPGFIRQEEGVCFSVTLKDISLPGLPLSDIITEKILDMTTNKSVPVTRKHLTVVSESKQVKLPINEVTLEANTVPEETPDNKYQYEWTSLHQPEGSTAVKHQNDNQLHLEKLAEGIYEFKVSVSTPTSYGETFVNVTVLPEARINTPPEIVITPANQTIKQPNAAAVLDASSSKDDDGIISWHWELQQGPLGYQPELKDSPTLQLNDLTKPGNYTFKLTVTDTDKATSSSTANITVLAVTDYPPEANAGEDKIIYLPHNNITLNGSLSTDDHAITTWEWTKSADDVQKTVDMQNTRTPYLQLSNLQEGMYTFTLKVMDSANQSSMAQVHVFVKPPTNKPPVAEAGPNVTISLPQTWAIVDGSNSTDDNHITTYKWEQVEGPSTAIFTSANTSKTNITNLTKGVYTVKLSVTDDNNNVASDTVFVIVNQNVNQKPTANAGPDLTIELPVKGIIVNGSQSKDDWEIVKWQWIRDEKSLAIGNIVEGTDQSPVLILTDVSVGTYIFNLTVWDKQGLEDRDTVTVIVKNDPKMFYLIDLTIDVDARFLTQAQFDTLKAKLALLVNEGSKLEVRSVKSEPGTGKVKLTFYLEGSQGQPVGANEVVQHLRQKLQVDASLLGFSVAKLQTSICQNNCSGHGVCNEVTRECECEVFWMHDMFKVYLNSTEDSDCSWSILYVVLGLICGVLTFFGFTWMLVYVCYRWCHSRHDLSKPTNYKLIEDTDDNLPPYSRKANLSETDSDSDVVFETRSKPPRFSDSRNGHKPARNGFNKPNRRVKT